MQVVKIKIQKPDGEEKEYPVTLNMARTILGKAENSGMLTAIVELSQIDEDKMDDEAMQRILATFVKYFDLVEFTYQTITNGEVNAGDMEVDVAVLQTMGVVQQFVAPMRYALSPDHLNYLKKNTSAEKAGEESDGKSV